MLRGTWGEVKQDQELSEAAGILGCWRIPPGGGTDCSGPAELYRHGDTGRDPRLGHIPEGFVLLETPSLLHVPPAMALAGQSMRKSPPISKWKESGFQKPPAVCRSEKPPFQKKDPRIKPTFPQHYGIYPEIQPSKLILSFPSMEPAAHTDQANNNRSMSLPCHLLAGKSFIGAAK